MKYPPNLCDLSQQERYAIEQDKARWFLAFKLVHKMNKPALRQYLNALKSDEEREDMRRRLNITWERYKK